jgi:uncharacterized membrane protein YoaK (UPF0700 family)
LNAEPAWKTGENRLPEADSHRFAIVASLSVPVVLSFVSAFVDVICYIGVFNTFVAFITGTIIILFTEIPRTGAVHLNKLAALPIFLAGLAAAALLIKAMRERGYQVILHYILMLEAVLLGMTMLLAPRLSPLPGPDSWPAVAVTGMAAFTMALQNVAMAMLLHFHTPTTLMTGNTTTLVIHVLNAGTAARYWVGNPPRLPRRALIRRYGAAILSFLAGATAGAVGWVIGGFLALAVPVLVLAGFALIIDAAGRNGRPGRVVRRLTRSVAR